MNPNSSLPHPSTPLICFPSFLICCLFFLSTSRSSCASSSSGVLRCPSAAVPVQYYKQSILYKETLHYMNTAFTALFSIECMLKIISFGVKVTAQRQMPTTTNDNNSTPPTTSIILQPTHNDNNKLSTLNPFTCVP